MSQNLSDQIESTREHGSAPTITLRGQLLAPPHSKCNIMLSLKRFETLLRIFVVLFDFLGGLIQGNQTISVQ